MFKVNKICLVLVIVCCVIACTAAKDFFAKEVLESDHDYVDPHSFYYDKQMDKEESILDVPLLDGLVDKNTANKNHEENCNESLRLCKISLRSRSKETDIADELLTRRLVNMLLSRAQFKKDGQLFIGVVELEATNSELEDLRKFGKGQLKLREADQILNNIIKQLEPNGIYESALWIYHMTSWMYTLFSNLSTYLVENKEIVSLVILIFYGIKLLNKRRYNLFIILPSAIMIMLVLSFVITWLKLIQEAEIKHSMLQMTHLSLPIHCQPEKMSFWDKLTNIFSSEDECKKYFEARMKTSFLEVTPAQAFSHMFAHILKEPLVICGTAIGKFIKNLTAGMPFIVAEIAQVLITITILPILICSLILLFGGSINLGFGPLSFLRLAGPTSTRSRRNESLESKSERKPIEIMLNIATNVQPTAGGNLETSSVQTLVPLVSKDKPKRNKSNDKTDSCASKAIMNEACGSGDCKVSNENSDSEDESIETNVKANGKEEIGSGDCVLE